MLRYVEGRNRNQSSMILMNLDKMIDEESPVRAIDVIVDSFDLGKLGKPGDGSVVSHIIV